MGTIHGQLSVGASWVVECWRGGQLVWREEIPENLVVTEGRNTLLDRTFKTVPANVNWYVGLKAAGAPQPGDTMASHPTWSEITAYSQATRPAYVASTPSNGSIDNGAAQATFTMTAATTISGAFLTSDATKGGTTGLLFSAGDFPVARNVLVDDNLTVKVTVSISAS